MKKGFFGILFLALFLIVSCTKDQDDELSLLGNWVEDAPVEGRTELFFRAGNRLTVIKDDGTEQELIYQIVDDKIILTLPEDPDSRSELFFSQIDENTIKIESLYPKFPEDPTTYIIFKRS